MFNTKVFIGNQPDAILMRSIHVFFKNRDIKIELPFVYFDISNPTWKDKNFFADFQLLNMLEDNI